jgi:hypothetical protein
VPAPLPASAPKKVSEALLQRLSQAAVPMPALPQASALAQPTARAWVPAQI